MGAASKEVRSRKWMITFQTEHITEQGWTHEQIVEALEKLKPQYYAIVDEVGGETHRLHTHVILFRPTAIRASTFRKLFPTAHMDALKGTMQEARNYLLKAEKWEGTEKAETTVPDTFFESGTMPEEKGRGHRSDLETMMDMVKSGYSDLEIIEAIPSLVDRLTAIQKYRQLVIEETAHDFRNMTVIYCYGKTGAGKTRAIYDEYADDKTCIYTVNDYHGTGIFDGYDSSRVKVLCLDEFRSQIPFGLLLSLTDGQYQVINCRYSNRIATHTTVYLISNIPLLQQYPNIQQNEPESWKALLRRITTVRHYYAVGNYKDYSVEEYLKAVRNNTLNDWQYLPPEATPFSN